MPSQESAKGQEQETGKKNSVETVFQSTLTATRNWLQRIFKKNMFQYSCFSPGIVSFAYAEEIKVSFTESREPAKVSNQGCYGMGPLRGSRAGPQLGNRPLCHLCWSLASSSVEWAAAASPTRPGSKCSSGRWPGTLAGQAVVPTPRARLQRGDCRPCGEFPPDAVACRQGRLVSVSVPKLRVGFMTLEMEEKDERRAAWKGM